MVESSFEASFEQFYCLFPVPQKGKVDKLQGLKDIKASKSGLGGSSSLSLSLNCKVLANYKDLVIYLYFLLAVALNSFSSWYTAQGWHSLDFHKTTVFCILNKIFAYFLMINGNWNQLK